MKRTTPVLIAIALVLTSCVPALEAGQLATINPALRALDLPISGYVAKPTATKISVPKDFLDKTYLYGGMVEAATDNCLTMGMGSTPLKVRFKVEGDQVLMLADQRELVPDIGASSEDVLNRYPMTEAGDRVELDFAHPELVNATIAMGGRGFMAQRPGYIYDVVNEPGYLSYGEKFLVATDGSDLPARVTLAVKYYLKEVAPSTYKGRAYTMAEFKKFGFFVTKRTQRQDDGTTKETVFADCRDLSKKFVYLLHPSIPEKYRPAFRDSILCWNKVFKQTHGVEPIAVRDGADNQIPGDIRCNVLYWVDYPTPYGGGAIGPHTSDPDTGEILDADIIFYAGAFRDEIASFREEAEAEKAPEASEAQVAAAVKEALKQQPELANRRSNRGFSLQLGGQTALDFTPACEFPIDRLETLAAKAHLEINNLTDDQAMERIIRETIPHEIGHTLGLRHNFKASADLANLTDGSNSTTVMDYVTSLQGRVDPGPYDVSAIACAYQGKMPEQSKDHPFFFATDGSQALDPLSNQFDLGDPLDYYAGKFDYFQKLAPKGYFASLAAYGRAQRKNLECLRKFVNRSEQSDKAFAFLVKVLTDKGEKPPFNFMERVQAMIVLTESQSRAGGAFEPLEDAQQAELAMALLKNVLPDGKDLFEVRLSMLEALKGLNNVYGYKAIETVAGAYKKFTEGAGAGKPLPMREQEMVLRVQQALGSYFAR